MIKQELKKILEEHKKWLDGKGGKKADLSRANLRWANLYEADLSRADLSEADLRGADLYGANLYGADLRGADLRGTDLRVANLHRADLRGANLCGADLRWANLYEADLSEANLRGANLSRADFRETLLNKTNLANTILDPKNILSNPSISEIEKAGMQVSDDGKYILAWRTCKSMYVGNTQYDLGTYEAPIFSSCTETECHPGLYFASKEWLIVRDYDKKRELVRVRVPIENNVVHVGDKWRCRKFEVLGNAEEDEIK